MSARSDVLDIKYQNDKLVILGSQLKNIKTVHLKGSSIDTELSIESQQDSQLIVGGALSSLSLVAGQVFNLIISDAHGASTFSFTVSVSDDSITPIMFATSGASSGDVIQFDGTNWGYQNLNGLTYSGTWDATTAFASDGTDLLIANCDGHMEGDYFVVNNAGTTSVNTESSWFAGDWIICSNSAWAKINNSSSVSILSDLNDVQVTTPADGQLLFYNNSNSQFENLNYLLFNTSTGNATFSNDVAITGSLSVASQGVCLADGTNCPGGSTPTTVVNGTGDVNLDASSGSDDINLQIGGSTQMTIASTGNVGIGDTTPAAKLVVADTENVTNGSHDLAVFNTGTTTNKASISIGYSADGAQTTSNTIASNNSLPLVFRTTSTSDALTILDNGHVGIGISVPQARLHMNDNSSWVYSTPNTTYSTPMIASPESSLTLSNGSATDGAGAFLNLFVKKTDGFTGMAYIGGISENGASAANIVFGQRTGSNAFSERMRIDTSGNIGIGTSTPTVPLEVSGNVKIGSSTTGTISAAQELVLRQDGDVFGSTILRLRNRSNENGAIFETNHATADLVDFIFKSSTAQRNIRFEARSAAAVGGEPSFHLNGADPTIPTFAVGSTATIVNTGNFGIGDPTPDAHMELSFNNNSTGLGFIISSDDNNDGDIFTVRRSGDVGIGTNTPSEKLHVVGNLRVQGTTDCTLGGGSGATNCTSDERLKDNIILIPNALDKIKQIRGVEFVWNERSISPGRESIGVIAQDIEAVFPTAVITNADGFLAVDYAVLVSPLIEATKELASNIEKYELMQNGIVTKVNKNSREIASIKEEVESLKKENEQMKAFLCSKFSDAPICH